MPAFRGAAAPVEIGGEIAVPDAEKFEDAEATGGTTVPTAATEVEVVSYVVAYVDVVAYVVVYVDVDVLPEVTVV